MLEEVVTRAGYEVPKPATASLPEDVPAVPATYVAREQFLLLKSLLLEKEGGTSVVKGQSSGQDSCNLSTETQPQALGMGGSGKTVLASCLVRDADVASSFGRVFWCNIGKHPSIVD